MPEAASYDAVFGPGTETAQPSPNPTPHEGSDPTSASYEAVFGTKPQSGVDQIFSPTAVKNPQAIPVTTTVDDRTLMQRYWTGALRQGAAGLLDLATGIPFSGASWLAAGLKLAARGMGPGEGDAFLKAAENINKGVGEGMQLIDTVAGRPVIEIPSWVPLIGGQDVVRTVAGFAPLPVVAGERLATAGAESAVKAFGKAFAFQLGLSEAQPAYELASAQNSTEAEDALKHAATQVASSAALTGLFFGVGALKGKVQEARRSYAVEQAKKGVQPVEAPEPTQGEKAMAAAIVKDTNEAGSQIGDAPARVNAELALRRQALQATILSPDEIQVYHGSGAQFDIFDRSKMGTGEGAQVYLEGNYVAEHPSIAKHYKEVAGPGIKNGLTDPKDIAAAMVHQMDGEDGAVAEIRRRIDSAQHIIDTTEEEVGDGTPNKRQQSTIEDHKTYIDRYEKAIDSVYDGSYEGKFYSVGLKKSIVPGMLDWDAPLKEQPKAVTAIRDLIVQKAGDNGPIRMKMMKDFDRMVESGKGSTGDALDYLRKTFPDYGVNNSTISKAIENAGFTGVKYLDAASRFKDQSAQMTRNYVVFNDRDLRILKPVEGVPRGTPVKLRQRMFGEFHFADQVEAKDQPGVVYRVEQRVDTSNAKIPKRMGMAGSEVFGDQGQVKYRLSRKLPDGTVDTIERYGLELRDVGPRYDPEVGAKAFKLDDGTVVMSMDMTHNAAAIEAVNRGLITKDTPVTDQQFGRIWGPEKRFYSEADYAKGREAIAQRDKALVEIETLERADQVASDTAAQMDAPGTGNEPPGTGYPGSPEPEKLTATQRHIQHGMAGGASFDFDVNTLPNVNPAWKHYGPLRKLYESVVLKPFNPLLTPDQQANLRMTIGMYEKIRQDGINRATQVRNQLEEIFPYLTREQRVAGNVPNTGYLAQVAAGTMETKYTIGDKVTQFGETTPWRVAGITEDGRYNLERNNQKKTVPEASLQAYGMLQRDAARAGFTWDQNLALEQGIRQILDTVHAEATAAGALKPGQYLKDYFVRSFEPPPNWNRERIQGFLKDFLSADAAINEHALHRLFRLHEEALDAGFTYKTNHIGTLIYNYMVSMAESTARSIARSSSVKQLKELGLVSRTQPNANWVTVQKADAPEFEGAHIPRDAFRMLKPIFEVRGGLDLIDKFDKWNHIAKRFGLGLDFYNSMNIIRGTISTGQNPFALGKFVDYMESQHPDWYDKALQGGLRMGLPTDYVARDQALERDYRLSHGEDPREAIREGKYGEAGKRALMKARGVFYWVEENLVQNMMETAKKAAFYKEYNKALAFEMDSLKRDLTPNEDTRLSQKVAYDVNQRFGGINLEQMGRSKMSRVGLRMLLLSPDWTESRLRLYADSLHEGVAATLAPIRAAFGDFKALDALKPQNTANLRSSVILFGATLAATELANLVLSGHTTDKNDKGNEFYAQLPFTTKYGTHPSVNLWGYQEMPLRLMYHMMNAQPELWFNERQAPALNAVTTWLFSQDNFGEKLTGDLPFVRPPITEREKNQRILLQKAMLTAGQLVPSIFTDLGAAMDRSMKDQALDGVRATRAIANFTAIKISSNYPQDLRREMDFFEQNATMTRAEVKRRFQIGKWQEAMDLKREWNDRVVRLQRIIQQDPSARAAFRRRSETISSFKIR